MAETHLNQAHQAFFDKQETPEDQIFALQQQINNNTSIIGMAQDNLPDMPELQATIDERTAANAALEAQIAELRKGSGT